MTPMLTKADIRHIVCKLIAQIPGNKRVMPKPIYLRSQHKMIYYGFVTNDFKGQDKPTTMFFGISVLNGGTGLLLKFKVDIFDQVDLSDKQSFKTWQEFVDNCPYVEPTGSLYTDVANLTKHNARIVPFLPDISFDEYRDDESRDIRKFISAAEGLSCSTEMSTYADTFRNIGPLTELDLLTVHGNSLGENTPNLAIIIDQIDQIIVELNNKFKNVKYYFEDQYFQELITNIETIPANHFDKINDMIIYANYDYSLFLTFKKCLTGIRSTVSAVLVNDSFSSFDNTLSSSVMLKTQPQELRSEAAAVLADSPSRNIEFMSSDRDMPRTRFGKLLKF